MTLKIKAEKIIMPALYITRSSDFSLAQTSETIAANSENIKGPIGKLLGDGRYCTILTFTKALAERAHTSEPAFNSLCLYTKASCDALNEKREGSGGRANDTLKQILAINELVIIY